MKATYTPSCDVCGKPTGSEDFILCDHCAKVEYEREVAAWKRNQAMQEAEWDGPPEWDVIGRL